MRATMATVYILFFVFLSAFICAAQESSSNRTTDPNEVEALRAFGNKLGNPPWNFSVDPCSGSNGWDNIKGADNFEKSSGIECDCTIENSSFCHVIKIAVISYNVKGYIAPEIGNFTYLNKLNLQTNLITGTLPEELGLLTNLQHVTVASNQIGGELPSSIGNLRQLLTLSIAVNNFTGTVPKEFGGLSSLTELNMDSTGLGGELPVEFGKLQNLKKLNMFDNNFNGSIPEFLGNMSSLEELKLYGNKFTGPIPAELGNLPQLKILEIGEVSSGGTIPSSYNRLTNLTGLSLRNCQLTGPIPELGNLTKLTNLDLSYNNLTGSIPASLSSLPLERLFLQNNNLTGTLPAKLGTLLALDVSFNRLEGSLPQIQRNASVVWNSFSIDQPAGPNSNAKECLEEKSNCTKVNNGNNEGFAINCGGQEIIADGTTFEADSIKYESGSGTYYSPSGTWAMTSSGFAESFRLNPNYYQSISGTSGDETQLYQNARTAPVSLRYFGLGMRTGRYTVRLHFAEIIIGTGADGPGVGRRFFDVYLQGQRKLKDFNIRDDAGSLTATVKEFQGVQVSNGVLDIHLLWVGRGTCCAPFRSYGPLISAIQVVPEFPTTGSSSRGSDSNAVKIGVGVAVPLVVVFLLAGLLLWKMRKSKSTTSDDEELKLLDGKSHLFSYNDLKNATGGFAPENILGKGAFGLVYKGVLPDGTLVAIKQLFKNNQLTKDFVNEAALISAVQHRNLVKLLGCCVEGDNRILVFEFLENNNVHQALLGSKAKMKLDWPTRFNICLGVAKGLAYLHEESSPRIIHRDIKATNVLLDKTLVPKIADFGLAKFFGDDQSHISTRVAGTLGYLAPEYALRGQLTEKADVYSYGVLVLEIVSGKPNIDQTSEDTVYLLDYAWKLYETENLLELVDKRADNVDKEQALRVLDVALLCTQAIPSTRPTMSKVVAMLTGSEHVDLSSLSRGYFSTLDLVTKLPQLGDSSKSSIDRGTDSPWRGSSSSGNMNIQPR